MLVVALHAYLPRGFEVGARFRYISGLPYTLAKGGSYIFRISPTVTSGCATT